MKVYIYYLIDKKIIKHLHLLGVLENISYHFVENEPFLYAYTNDKKIAKKFEETRNSSVFFRKVVDMNEDEFSKFEFSYRSEIKIDENELKVGKDNYVIFPTTISEYSYSVYYGRETINDILEKIPKIPLCIFTGKSKEELSGISYNTEILHEEDVKVNKFVKKYGWRNDFMLLCIIYKNILDFDANSIEVVRVNDR